MLAKLNLKGFGDSMIEAIDKFSLRELINLDMDYLAPRVGSTNAANFMALMEKLKTETIYDYTIIGSLGFSGIAAKKWQNLFSRTTINGIIHLYEDGHLEEFLKNTKGVGPVTAETICNEMPDYIDDIRYIRDNMPNVIESYGVITGKQIRFSGCRNLLLEQQLFNAGHDADSNSSVTKQTDILLVPYEGYTSSKTKKMPETGVIVPIQDFMSNMEYYLG
jgi:hypothetical protein